MLVPELLSITLAYFGSSLTTYCCFFYRHLELNLYLCYCWWRGAFLSLSPLGPFDSVPYSPRARKSCSCIPARDAFTVALGIRAPVVYFQTIAPVAALNAYTEL